ncbi:MAG: glycine cleavage system protein GcvH [Phycisphaerae bacterium]|nr:glycine cleavage system protein GcvH [Phycisphaerae bacterium]
MFPAELRYTKGHEWAKMDAGTVTVGITEFAVEQLGDVVYLELPAAGESVKADSPFGVVESVKAAVDLNCPVSGEIIEANEDLPAGLELLGKDPYGAAWMVKIKTDGDGDFKNLMSAEEYEKFIAAEGSH